MVSRLLSGIALASVLVYHGLAFAGDPNTNTRSKSASGDTPHFLPVELALGNSPSTHRRIYGQFHLNQSVRVATLDYGVEVAGYPFFKVESVTGPVQIEVKYSEEAAGLDHDFSDGPFPFSVGLANTYRVETFEIGEPGRIDAFLLQGGQRWQSIRLITDGSLKFSSVGFVSSVPVMDLGARAASVSCLEAGTQRAMWEIDESDGAYIRGMRPGVTAMGAFFANYTVEFETKIDKGGIGWVVAFPLASPMQGIQLNLVANHQPFANFNKTLLRPNSILFSYGYSYVNATTLPSWHLDTFDVPLLVEDDTWYKIKTVLDGENLSAWIDHVEIFNIALKDYPINDARLSDGLIPSQASFGFGGWQDQASHVRNVAAYDTRNGTELYRNPLTDTSVLQEYGVQANYESACLDGPKHDRLVWLGDLLHTVRVVAASTSRFDLVRGTLQLLVDWQAPSGLLPYDPPLGYDPDTASDAFARGGGPRFMGVQVYGIILVDYQILGVLAFTDYVRLSNDLEFARKTWTQWKSNLRYLISNIDASTGLISLPGAFLGPSQGGSAVNCALLQALTEMGHVAEALGELADSSSFRKSAISLSSAVNNHLWNEDTGTYGNSLTDLEGISVASIGFCITSGAASPEKAARFIQKLKSLKLGPGYKDSTSSNSSDPSVNLSPNTNGFMLPALLMQNSSAAAAVALDLIKSLWTPMVSDKKTSTGASWEYVSQEGKPGLGLYTSLSHPWGGAPTYLLTQWVVGIHTAEGADGFGYRKWVVDPYMGVHMGLARVSGRVMTAFGSLEVQWQLKGSALEVIIRAPIETSGLFKLGRTQKELSGSDYYSLKIEL
ncbi:hypothetical protein AK830_g4039 [Neonectria ditissima]|uniref:Alpha-L-rhamnosidase six-hairpin glycosidase domain-containing protein n=1 Tax=Neonectria ditissima TaxID=78410 RepID=A0A0P7B7E8_9HYPO|nr:hypothetical protein AK830_g4039 [Neonectria ditissima]